MSDLVFHLIEQISLALALGLGFVFLLKGKGTLFLSLLFLSLYQLTLFASLGLIAPLALLCLGLGLFNFLSPWKKALPLHLIIQLLFYIFILIVFLNYHNHAYLIMPAMLSQALLLSVLFAGLKKPLPPKIIAGAFFLRLIGAGWAMMEFGASSSLITPFKVGILLLTPFAWNYLQKNAAKIPLFYYLIVVLITLLELHSAYDYYMLGRPF